MGNGLFAQNVTWIGLAEIQNLDVQPIPLSYLLPMCKMIKKSSVLSCLKNNHHTLPSAFRIIKIRLPVFDTVLFFLNVCFRFFSFSFYYYFQVLLLLLSYPLFREGGMEQSERCDFLSFCFFFPFCVSVKGRNFTRAYLSIVKKLASSSSSS